MAQGAGLHLILGEIPRLQIPVWVWEEAEVGTGAAVFIPSWKLGWDRVALIQTRSLAWFEGGNIPTFQIKYDTNIYSQTYKNRSTFKTRQRDAQCDLESQHFG